jgi:hypothetical protein
MRRPYTAEFKITHVQTLGNGATITRESTRLQASDSQQRFMSSTTTIQQYGDHAPLTTIIVDDKANGTQTSWDSRTRKATVVKEPPPEQQHGCWQTESGNTKRYYSRPHPASSVAQSDSHGKLTLSVTVQAPPSQRPGPVREDLGTMTIQGVEAHGYRTTTTTPVGEIGNDQPLVQTQEEWVAPGLGFQVRSVRDDPQQGKETQELVKLDQGEPDAALFQPPEGYEIVTEAMIPCKEQ